MQFLSLGLLPPQNDEDTRIEEAGTNNRNTADVAAAPVLNSASAPKQTLPPALEELHERLQAKAQPRTVEPLTASVDSLTPSQRGGIPTFSTFKFGYLPTRGLLYSIIGHELALFALFILFTYGLPSLRAQKLIAHDNTQDHVLYLPELGGGSTGEKTPGGGPTAAPEQSAAPAHASKGFAYPGRQAILSDPKNPTNAFQTIQRPLLVHPEPIQRLVPLPNIIQMAETRLPSDLLATKAAMPQLKEVPKPIRVKQDSLTHRNAKFQVPVDEAPQLVAKNEMPKLPAAELPIPEAPQVQPQPKKDEEQLEAEKPAPTPIKVTAEKRGDKTEREVAPPSEAQIARMEMHGKNKEPLLSLSPMPLPANPNAKIPNGEARGRFAIAPGGTLNPSTLTPGKMNVPLSATPGMGRDKTEAANAATDSNASSGNGAGHAEAGGGGTGTAKTGGAGGVEVAGNGSGKTSGEGAGGSAGTGKGGRGTSGNGAGANSGRGNGAGSGGGSGSGAGSFPGITIQGGEDATAANMNPPKFTIEQQPAYRMTVVSTASSGGGLEDFGVFHDERVFTVYIPMKRSEDEEDPTWTLQYALQDESADNGVGQVLAPSPAQREWPEIPADLQQKYSQHQVVVSALIGTDGKVSDVTVKRTPDPRISDPVAQALAKWIFHPAQLNGQPVGVKILIGFAL
jgi:Gram-negative bacterial TonB protein C-terminal